jgi:acetyltransferase-like isoleucine patch superfamily enzyme
MGALTDRIQANPGLKKWLHWMMVPRGQARPRLWVSLLLNPFKHERGRGSRICRRTRLDVLPFRPFRLGAGSTIEDFATVNNGVGAVMIGDRTRIGIGCVLIGPLTIGSDVMLAQNIVCSGLNHGYADINQPIADQPVSTAEIVIEDEVWIGANSVITAGVRVGKHSVVGGGSVVTRDVPPYCVVGGNPARILRRYDEKSSAWIRVLPAENTSS